MSSDDADTAPDLVPLDSAPTEPSHRPAAAPRPRLAPPRSPGLALFLSFVFPGAGQLYNGQPAKAFAFFFGLVCAIYLTAEVDPMPFAFMIPFTIIYNLIDAWKTATLMSLGGVAGAIEEETGFESPAWGGGLIGLGLLLLLNNLGWLDLASLRRYWPVLLILAGAWFLAQSLRDRGTHGGGT